MVEVDHIIIGQGICGTLLSRALMQAGRRVLVIDDNKPSTASKIASGIMNPVTGKRWVESWMTETFTSFAVDTYRALEVELQTPLLQQTDIVNFHYGNEQRALFEAKAVESEYLQTIDGSAYEQYFYFHHGGGVVQPCWLVDVAALLAKWKQYLMNGGSYKETTWDWEQLQVKDDGVIYNNIHARSVITCMGVADKTSPYFSRLPFSDNKGEALLVRIPGLPADTIYKRGFSIVPWEGDVFWVGASFEWQYDTVLPTEKFRHKVETQLQEWLRLPFEVIGHFAAERPTTMEYKPFVGMHPAQPCIGIMNGMGTKGCSMAPYFAQQLTEHLLHNTPILQDVNIQRFHKILLR